MSWKSRVNDEITLRSPSGILFRASWQGNKRTKEKKVGLFEYPKAKGTLAQDLDVSGTKYPLNIFFEGADHDLDAQRFWDACDERGIWEVLHPVRGTLTLQLITVSEDIQPITSGGITEFDLEWVEVGIDNPSFSVAQFEADVYEQLEQLRKEAANQFDDTVTTDKPSQFAKLKAAVMKAIAVANKIQAVIGGITAVVSAIRATVLGVINAKVMLMNSLASSIMSLILLPGMINKDAKSRFNYYNKVLDTTFTDFQKDFDKTYGSGGVNTAAMVELIVTSCIFGMAQTVTEARFSTRKEALGYLEQIETAVSTVISNLDTIQSAYAGQFIDRQYFSQSDSFIEMMELLCRVRELILRRSFDLAAAKTITLRKDRAPIEIALTEGVDFDLFIDSNDLHGDDILLLPAGRQVVIYHG